MAGGDARKNRKSVGNSSSVQQKAKSAKSPLNSRDFLGGVTTVWHCRSIFSAKDRRNE